MGLLTLVVTLVIIAGVGGGGMYLFWVKTRPKKKTWNATVYTLGQGVRKVEEVVNIQDIKPYCKDIIEQVEKPDGTSYFRLQKLDIIVADIEQEAVENWGGGQKEVSVLVHGGTAALLRKSYNKSVGELVFEPLKMSRISFMKGEIAHIKSRLHKSTDILQAITPWIVTGMLIIGICAIAYIMVEGFSTISEENSAAQKYVADKNVEAAQILAGVKIEEASINKAKAKPPLIEGG